MDALERWKQRAAAMAPDMPGDAAENAARVMMRIEEGFTPLLRELKGDVEPAYVALVQDPPAS